MELGLWETDTFTNRHGTTNVANGIDGVTIEIVDDNTVNIIFDGRGWDRKTKTELDDVLTVSGDGVEAILDAWALKQAENVSAFDTDARIDTANRGEETVVTTVQELAAAPNEKLIFGADKWTVDGEHEKTVSQIKASQIINDLYGADPAKRNNDVDELTDFDQVISKVTNEEENITVYQFDGGNGKIDMLIIDGLTDDTSVAGDISPANVKNRESQEVSVTREQLDGLTSEEYGNKGPSHIQGKNSEWLDIYEQFTKTTVDTVAGSVDTYTVNGWAGSVDTIIVAENESAAVLADEGFIL